MSRSVESCQFFMLKGGERGRKLQRKFENGVKMTVEHCINWEEEAVHEITFVISHPDVLWQAFIKDNSPNMPFSLNRSLMC